MVQEIQKGKPHATSLSTEEWRSRRGYHPHANPLQRKFPLLYEARASNYVIKDRIVEVETAEERKLWRDELLPTNLDDCLSKLEEMERTEQACIAEIRAKINTLHDARLAISAERSQRHSPKMASR